jgi:hypothetical protein
MLRRRKNAPPNIPLDRIAVPGLLGRVIPAAVLRRQMLSSTRYVEIKTIKKGETMRFNSSFFFVASCLFLFSCAGMIPTPNPTIEQQKALEKIKEFQGISKSDLFNRSMNWVARAYNSANNVIQLKDQENGQIVCKGIGSAPCALGVVRYFRYTQIVDIKDGKIRIRYESIESDNRPGLAGPNMSMEWNYVEPFFNKTTDDLFASIINIEKEKNW